MEVLFNCRFEPRDNGRFYCYLCLSLRTIFYVLIKRDDLRLGPWKMFCLTWYNADVDLIIVNLLVSKVAGKIIFRKQFLWMLNYGNIFLDDRYLKVLTSIAVKYDVFISIHCFNFFTIPNK